MVEVRAMDSEIVVLRPIVETCAGFGNTRLKGFEVIDAPPHVCRHILVAQIGEIVKRDWCETALVDLALKGYAVEIQPRSVVELCALEFRAQV